MDNGKYEQLKISCNQAEEIAFENYGIQGKASPLPGELDFNFRILSKEASFVLKISRPDTDEEYISFQKDILDFLEKDTSLVSPEICRDINGQGLSKFIDKHGNSRIIRMYSWVDGRLWSSVNPVTDSLLYSLGEQAGKLTKALSGFDHSYARRDFEWDTSRAAWTRNYLELFNGEEKDLLEIFHERFERIRPKLEMLRQAVIHNDANDNNVIVSNDLVEPEVVSIIDFGDAIYTAAINDLAVAIAYAVMEKPAPLKAALPLIRGYHHSFPLHEDELECLHTLVAMRLIISVTKSAINKQKEPGNKYLVISEKPAWELLIKWLSIDKEFAHYSFREVCGFDAVPAYQAFKTWADGQQISIKDMFPGINFTATRAIDMSIGSLWLEAADKYRDAAYFGMKFKNLRKAEPENLFAGGYHEIRPFYCTEQFNSEGNSGPMYRSMHLGIDIWTDEEIAIHSPLDGRVFNVYNNAEEGDYGPTLILEHEMNDGNTFYSLFGHLGEDVLHNLSKGDPIRKGQKIASIGGPEVNGGWASHLHFQFMLNLIGNTYNFPGVGHPDEKKVWEQLCPDPGLLFTEEIQVGQTQARKEEIQSFRSEHLGKSLSVSYDEPIMMLRGEGAFLIDNKGRKYLDTVNNVAHIGHEHPSVVKAGQEQMRILNTNTRYLHPNIVSFAEKLLATFPSELSVVHFVNSGSEANELALRMAKIYTGRKDIIAVEVGYHGNTGACIDVSSYKFDGKGGAGAPEYTHIVPLPDAFRGKHRGSDSGLKYAEYIGLSIREIEEKGRSVAAFLCESIISCGGQIELPEGYLEAACSAVRNAGGVYIADEVQVGCGRVGSAFWGFQLHNVVPDIVTIGKPIGNGHPLAAVVCTGEIADAFANGMEYFNTFGGNPVSCAIGKTVLEVISNEGLQQNALETGNYLKTKLKNLKKSFPIIGDVRGQGLFLGFELNGPGLKPLGNHASYLANRMKDLGILMSIDGPDHNVLKIKPPMVFSKENADELIWRLELVMNEDFMKAYE